ncbi:PEP-CTERM sorting domain-containing protein [Paludisphaera sp.]|uniref:PEP-CTERM sorting domain-containing protein n=1 Tax=Paludisphaera sp. TaxID=2017432 RepID=UPI00301C5C6F
MKSSYLRILLATALVVAVGRSHAGPVTGDPAADGWDQLGNSKALGTYVRGDGNFDYTLYTRSFVLDSSEATTFGGSWQAGDLVLGIGATVAKMTGDDVSQSVRIVAKFGASDSTFSPSTTLTIPGNGDGSMSEGHGGEGAILLGTNAPNPQFVVAANAGVIHNYSASGHVMERQGASLPVTALNAATVDAGRLIFLTGNGGGTLLSSLEVYLNVSQLQRQGFTLTPTPGDDFVLTLQRSNNAFRDALGTTAELNAVPEPSSLVLAGLGAAGLVVALRRRAGR